MFVKVYANLLTGIRTRCTLDASDGFTPSTLPGEGRMATKARVDYGWSESLTPTMRCAKCSYCGETIRQPRRNALASTSRLRGRIRDHIRERHPDKIVCSVHQ